MRVFTAILWKDLRHEWRRKELVAVMALFSLVVLVLFSFALGVQPEHPSEVAAAVLWIAFTFAGTLGLNRSMSMERENHALHALLMCPADRAWVYLAKTTGNLLFMLVVEAIITPLCILVFNIDPPRAIGWTMVTFLAGSAGFVSVGTLLAGIASGTRVRDWLLPLLLFPIQVPVLISAVRATSLLLAHRPLEELWVWLKILGGFDLLFIAISIWAFESIVEE